VESEKIQADHDKLLYFIQQFFQNGDIAERFGSLFEATVSSTLLGQDLNLGRCMIWHKRKYRFQIPDENSIDNPKYSKARA
jgi:hypothetical protein